MGECVGGSRFLEQALRMSQSEDDRVIASRLLLVALLGQAELGMQSIEARLRKWLDRVRAASSPYYFDLGYGEDVESTLGTLADLRWVTIHNSETRYKATPVGSAHVQLQRDFLTKTLGVDLDELLSLTQDER